jgi:hypothetical protein
MVTRSVSEACIPRSRFGLPKNDAKSLVRAESRLETELHGKPSPGLAPDLSRKQEWYLAVCDSEKLLSSGIDIHRAASALVNSQAQTIC